MKKNKIYILIIFIIALFTMMPMLTSEFCFGHDTEFHLTNIISLTEQIKNNFLNPSRIVGNIGLNFGYATNIFYSPIVHMVTSYLNVLINNPIISIKLIHLITLFISGLSMFFLSKRLSKSNEIGLVSSIIYMLFPYYTSDIYIREALSESFIFMFLPLILLSLYELFSEDGSIKRFYLLFIFGYVGGMLSHLTIMSYFTIIIFIYLIFNFKKTIKNLKHFIIASILIFGITSPFLVGLFEHKLLGSYNVFKEGVMVQGTWGNALNPLDYINVLKNFGNGEIKYFIDIITLILLIITLIKFKKLTNKWYNAVLVFGIIGFILSTKIFPWDIFPKSFRLIQFPWRFETFVSISVSLIAPICLVDFKDKKTSTIFIILSIFLLAQPNLRYAWNGDAKVDINNLNYYNCMGWQMEYLPVKTAENIDYFNNRNHDIIIKENEGSINIIKDDVPYLEFNVETDKNITIELPRTYYIGYKLIDSNNNEIDIYEGEYGFIEANLSSGTYILNYTGTSYYNIARIVSLISLILVIVVWRFYDKRNRTVL